MFVRGMHPAEAGVGFELRAVMTKIAQQIKWVEKGLKGTAALFKLTPPITSVSWDDAVETHEYVIVSAVVAMFSGPETYIFPADAEGYVTNWAELPGSFQGALDIWQALRNAGYEPQGLTISG